MTQQAAQVDSISSNARASRIASHVSAVLRMNIQHGDAMSDQNLADALVQAISWALPGLNLRASLREPIDDNGMLDLIRESQTAEAPPLGVLISDRRREKYYSAKLANTLTGALSNELDRREALSIRQTTAAVEVQAANVWADIVSDAIATNGGQAA
jgi:hypothetical protein